MDYVVRFENRTTIVGKKCSEEELTYKAYSVGDDVTLKDDTTWIVVKDSLESDGEIKIMSSLNINKNLESETTLIGKDMFVSDESSGNYKLAYDTTESNNWDSSTLKSYLENVVKERLQQSLKTEIIEISILGAEELVSLGCELTGSEEKGYSAVSCDTTTEWYEKVFNSTGFWTKLRYTNTKSAWYINKKTIYYYRVKETTIFGARPVITVSKSAIK